MSTAVLLIAKIIDGMILCYVLLEIRVYIIQWYKAVLYRMGQWILTIYRVLPLGTKVDKIN